MQCIKCGRETDEHHVFCSVCLADMEKFPVKAGTPVTIPKRPKKQHVPVAKKEKPEDMVLKLQKQIRFLGFVCMTLLLAFAISVGVIVYHFTSTDHNAPAIGQNYSTEAADDAPNRR